MLHLVLGLAVAASLAFVEVTQSGHGTFTYTIAVAYSGLMAWQVATSLIVFKDVLHPLFLFFIASALFHGGQVVLLLFGVPYKDLMGWQFSEESIGLSIVLVTLGHWSLHLGALLYLSTKDVLNTTTGTFIPAKRHPPFDHKATVVVAWSLIAVSLIPSLQLAYEQIGNVAKNGYAGLYLENSRGFGFDAWSAILAGFLTSGMFLLLATHERFTVARSSMYAFSLALCTMTMALGTRGQAATTLLAFAWTWDLRIKRVPRVIAGVAGLFILFVVFPLIGAVREAPLTARADGLFNLETGFTFDTTVVAILQEMGSSLSSVTHTLDLVPEKSPHNFGEDYLYAAYTIVPNVFWDIHPTADRGTPADWLVENVAPGMKDMGFGLGFSYLAEAYLNFSWAGVILIPAVLGFGIVWLVAWTCGGNVASRYALTAYFMSTILFFARGESSTQIRQIAWYALMPYAATLTVRYAMSRILRPRTADDTAEGVVAFAPREDRTA